MDTVGDPDKYAAKLKGIFPSLKFTVCSKADSKFPIVSGASICAKVVRDQELENWKFREGEIDRDFGCGYPSGKSRKLSWILNRSKIH